MTSCMMVDVRIALGVHGYERASDFCDFLSFLVIFCHVCGVCIFVMSVISVIDFLYFCGLRDSCD